MDAYRALTAGGTSTRTAARVTGIARSTVDRDRRRPTGLRLVRRAPANALSEAERALVSEVLDSPQFVDAAPAQVYAALLDQGVYLGSIATMYRILREHRQVRERRRQARHRPRTRPELVATGPGQVYSWDITKLAGPAQLVSYDDQGMEIDRRPLFQAEDQLDHCYATPSGTLIYGKPATNCLPTEAWQR